MTKIPSPSIDEDFEAIEAAVLETARGRWFLAEYLRRHQAKETRSLLEAMKKLESSLGGGDRLAAQIAEIMKNTAEKLSEIGELPHRSDLPLAVVAMAEEAAAMATRMEEGPAADDLKDVLAAQQHLMARKLEAVADCLKEISAICGLEKPVAVRDPENGPGNSEWFAPAAGLVESAPAHPQDVSAAAGMSSSADAGNTVTSEGSHVSGGENGHLSIMIEPRKPERMAPPQAETGAAEDFAPARPRIIITRKPSSEEVDIPMARTGHAEEDPKNGEDGSGTAGTTETETAETS